MDARLIPLNRRRGRPDTTEGCGHPANPLYPSGSRAMKLESSNGASTEHRLAEQDRERFFMISLDMLCVAGFDGYFKRVNPAWEGTLGYTADELQSEPFLSFVHPDDREGTESEAAKLATGVETIRFENRYRCKDG